MPRGVKVRDDGDGTVYQEGPRRWRAELVIDGKKVKRSSTTEKGAKAKLKELRALRDARLNVGEGKQTLSAWSRFYLTTILPGKQVKPMTLEGHTYVIGHYILPYLGHHQLIKLNAPHVDEWQQELRAKGLSEGTIANARRRLSAMLAAACKRKLVPENVVKLTDKPLSTPRRRDVLDTAQLTHLLAMLLAEGHRLYALYVLAAALGLRQGELMGLRWPAVDLSAGTLIVREQLQRIKGPDGKRRLHREDSTKGTREQERIRVLHLSPELVAVLVAHLARQRQEKLILGDAWRGEDLVFTSEDGTPLEGSALGRQFKRALRRAGLPEVTFHSLRHSAGSVMLANGAQLIAVSEVLGHSSVAVTARIYAHSFDEGRKQAVAASASALLRRA